MARARHALTRARFRSSAPPPPLAQVFNGVVGTFLVFFALFATVIYPNAAMLHPTAWYATRLTTRTDAPSIRPQRASRRAPRSLRLVAGASGSRRAPPRRLRRADHPTPRVLTSRRGEAPSTYSSASAPWASLYADFYTMAELWGSVVASLLFWGFATSSPRCPRRRSTTSSYSRMLGAVTARGVPPPAVGSPPAALPSPRYYPLFGLGANVALVFSGQFVRCVVSASAASGWRRAARSTRMGRLVESRLMGGVVVSGSAVRRGPPARSEHCRPVSPPLPGCSPRRPMLAHFRCSASTTT